jgi:thiol-disulfide isomerase/thioredoxin
MKKSIVIALFCLPLVVLASEKTKVKFFKGALKADLKEVKASAKAEGKGYILDFVASWCTPCKWMEETTYNDPTLADYMSKNFIPVKVDIDDIEGFDLKEKYKVEMLPTIIVFDASGKVMARYNESMGPTKLMTNLKKIRDENVAITRPGFKPEAAEPTKPSTKPETIVDKPIKRTYAPGSGLYKMDISRKANSGFSIQICSLSQYDNVVKKFDELKAAYNKPVLINVEAAGTKVTYKILVGEFKTKEEADKFKKNKAIDGFIKDLSTLR